jgi:hypothetical protein
VESNEAQRHQIISEIDRPLVGRVDQRAQPDQYDSRDPRAHPQDQKDQTSEFDEIGQTSGQLRGQQLLGGLSMKEHLRHVEVADLHHARPEEEGGDPATQEQLDGGIAPARQGLEDTGDRPRQWEGGGGDTAPDQCVERDRPSTLDDKPSEQDRPEQVLIQGLVGELNDQGQDQHRQGGKPRCEPEHQ